MTNDYFELGYILVSMGILSDERLEELIDQYKKEGKGTFNRFLVKEEKVSWDLLNLAILKRRVG